MKPGSKYRPLQDHLKHSDQPEVMLIFAEVEALLGSALLHSAVERKNWWSNRETSAALQALQASAWVGAGYHVHAIDIDRKVVTFRKFAAQYNI